MVQCTRMHKLFIVIYDYDTISYNVTSYDGCSRLDRTILILDGFLEIVSKPCKNANPGF